MIEKMLPIKFFEKRKIDEQLTEAGGSRNLPKWVMQGASLENHAQYLSSSVSRIAKGFEAYKKEAHTLPMVIATTILDEALAKTHRKAIVDLLNSDNNPNVIGMEPIRQRNTETVDSTDQTEPRKEKASETHRLISIVTTDELISNINKVLHDTQGAAKLISSIADFEPFAARCDYNPGNKAYRVILHDYHNAQQNQHAHALFKDQCAANGITIAHEARYSSDMWLHRVTIDTIEQLEAMEKFDCVRSIEEAIPICAGMDSFGSMSVPAVKKPVDGVEYPVVGVLDNGIQKNRYLSPWILEGSEEYYEQSMQDKSHGSMVASVLEYSDELNGTRYCSTDGVMMLEAVVVPDLNKESVYPEDIIDNVRDAIERHRDIKVWTMSVGTNEECDRDSFGSCTKLWGFRKRVVINR